MDVQRGEAAASRLRRLGARVIEIECDAVQSVKEIVENLNRLGLHFAFLDTFAPGWPEEISVAQSQLAIRQQVFHYWRDKVASLGV